MRERKDGEYPAAAARSSKARHKSRGPTARPTRANLSDSSPLDNKSSENMPTAKIHGSDFTYNPNYKHAHTHTDRDKLEPRRVAGLFGTGYFGRAALQGGFPIAGARRRIEIGRPFCARRGAKIRPPGQKRPMLCVRKGQRPHSTPQGSQEIPPGGSAIDGTKRSLRVRNRRNRALAHALRSEPRAHSSAKDTSRPPSRLRRQLRIGAGAPDGSPHF